MKQQPSMPPELWSAVVSMGDRRAYPAGSLVFAEGDPAGPVLAILNGSVALTAGDGGRLDEFGQGELLGELSAVDGLPRSASALAITDTEVLAIDPGRFARLLVGDPKLALHLLRSVGCRLRRATTRSIAAGDRASLSSIASEILAANASRDRGSTTRPGILGLATRCDVSIDRMSRAVEHLAERGAVAIERGAIVVVDPVLLGTFAGPRS